MNRTLGQNQIACRTHASLKKVPTVGGSIRASYYQVGMHLRLSVLEGDIANERKQFHLFGENAGWIVLFRLPVEPTQLPAKPCPLANCYSTLAISSPVVFGSSSICFHRVKSPFQKISRIYRKQERTCEAPTSKLDRSA